MKKMLITLTLLIVSISMSAQTVSHIVQRGETIESIAQKYSVSVEDLKNVNPDAKEYFYVGMKLSIPAARIMVSPIIESNQNVSNNQDNVALQQQVETSEQQATYTETKEDKGWAFTDQVGYGFMSGDAYVLHFDLGANYFFKEKYTGLYAGARLGYEICSIKTKTSEYNVTTGIHNIILPVELGYALTSANKKIAIIPFAGLTFRLRVKTTADAKMNKGVKTSSGYKYKDEYTDEIEKGITDNNDNSIRFSFRPGVKLRLWGFNIGYAYNTSLQKGGKGYSEIFIGYDM